MRLASWLVPAVVVYAGSAICFSGTITVNTTSDSSTAGDGACSLREAISNANANADQTSGDCASGDPGLDIIVFKIPGAAPFTIVPATPLPLITDPLILDATSQTGFSGSPIIELDGEISHGIGIEIAIGGSIVEGFVINRFDSGVGVDSGAGNVIRGNWIGLDNTGTVASPNGYGIGVAPNTTIGGTSAGERNVISGNANIGVVLTDYCTLQGNYIGTNAIGSDAIPNLSHGVAVQGLNCLVGGTTAGAGNVISGNIGDGVYIAGIAGNAGLIIQGNFIGIDATGSHALGNSNAGVQFFTSTGNLVGGTTAGSANVISGNDEGVVIGSFLFNADGNTVQGNFVGTDATGLNAIPNRIGIEILNSSDSLVGGTQTAARNVVSGNGCGVSVDAANVGILHFPTNNVIRNNYIGTDSSGEVPVGNGSGVCVEDSIGGVPPAIIDANLIAGNGSGVFLSGWLLGNQSPEIGALVTGNAIGISPSGAAIGNGNGILIEGGRNCQIGGSAANAGNVIVGNSNDGLLILAGSAHLNRIEGNFIGTTPSGAPVANAGYGVEIFDAQSNTIGGADASSRNVIAFNGGGGIGVGFGEFGETVGNRFLSNSIHDDGGLGIDLLEDGVSPNGSITTLSQMQRFPSLTHVLRSSVDGRLFILGSQNSNPSDGSNEIQYFRADGDPTGYGEGEDLLRDVSGLPSGSFAIATGAFVPLVPVSVGDPVTATATTSNGTSEFSANVSVVANTTPLADAGSNQTVNRGASVLLDGSGSSDPDSLPSGLGITDGEFAWTQIHGTPVVLANPTAHNPSFQALDVGFIQFSLVVNDGLDSSTNMSTVTVAVVNPNDKTTPIALSQTISPQGNTLIKLAGTDPDNTSFLFAITQQPLHGSITDFEPLKGTLEYKPTPGFVGLDAFQFTVSDGMNVSAPGTVTLLVGITNPRIPTLSFPMLLLLAFGIALTAGLVLRR